MLLSISLFVVYTVNLPMVDPGLAGLFINSTLLHLGEDINSFGHVIVWFSKKIVSRKSLASLNIYQGTGLLVKLKVLSPYIQLYDLQQKLY
jgi:hypothetical protein